MNYLAHACLSFNDPDILVGNMISDFVKGKQQFSFSAEIRQGIILHREIDEFTDKHPVTHEAKKIFQADYRLYSAAFTDVAFDHFLATDESRFSEASLKKFCDDTYHSLEKYSTVFPLRFAAMFPHMKKQNWLFNYRTESGIQRSFEGLVYRATYMHESETAFRLFQQYHGTLKNCFDRFYPDLENFAYQRFKLIRQL